MKLLTKLSFADYITFLSLSLAFLAIILLLNNQPFWAINASLASFMFDILDGYIARLKSSFSDFGKYLDSFNDVFIYLLFSIFLTIFYVSKVNIFSLFVSVVLLFFGILRLIRYTGVGEVVKNQRQYYVGYPVYFPYFITIFFYFFDNVLIIDLGNFLLITLLIISFLMISELKTFKTRNLFVLLSIFVLIFYLNFYVHFK